MEKKERVSRNEKTKNFVIYQRVFHGEKPLLRKITGNLVMPMGIENVTAYFQKLRPYGIKMLNRSTYIQNNKGIFMPAQGGIDEVSDNPNTKLDSIVFAHSLNPDDTRDAKTKEESKPIVIETEFTKGVITGEIYVQALRRGAGSEEDIPALENYLKKNRVITIHNFKNEGLEALFEHELDKNPVRYRKPYRVIVNTDRITSYGFQKRK